MIPKIFHRIWPGKPGKDNEIPELYEYYGRTWKKLHPNWNFCLWHDDNMPELINQEQYDNARNYAEKSSIARMEMVYRFGGVYIDTDFECFQNIEPLLEGVEAFVGCEEPGIMTDALIGGIAGHPAFHKLIEGLPENMNRFKGYGANITVGPVYWTKTLNARDIKMFPPKIFYPVPPPSLSMPGLAKDYPNAYGNHHWAASWVGSEKPWKGFSNGTWKKIVGRQIAILESMEPKSPPEYESTEKLPIPKIIHQIWLGHKPIPEDYLFFSKTWQKNHPDWEYHLWTDKDVPTLINQQEYEDALTFSERSDILRFELLYKYGGVYADMDFESYKNLEPLIKGVDVFAGKSIREKHQYGDREWILLALMGSVPGHPTIKKLIDNVGANIDAHNKNRDTNSSARTGPIYASKVINDNELKLFPPTLFYPTRWDESPEIIAAKNQGHKYPEAYANHHWGVSWQQNSGETGKKIKLTVAQERRRRERERQLRRKRR